MKIVTIIYLGLVLMSQVLIFQFNYHHPFSWLIHPIFSVFLLAYLLWRGIKHKEFTSPTLRYCFMATTVGIFISSFHFITSPRTLWLGYSDGVISGDEIHFKEGGKFEYCTTTLFGNWRYRGTYSVQNDTIFLEYNNHLPTLNSTTLVMEDNHLVFLREPSKPNYSFEIYNSTGVQIP